jgi:hypothetical protein
VPDNPADGIRDDQDAVFEGPEDCFAVFRPAAEGFRTVPFDALILRAGERETLDDFELAAAVFFGAAERFAAGLLAVVFFVLVAVFFFPDEAVLAAFRDGAADFSEDVFREAVGKGTTFSDVSLDASFFAIFAPPPAFCVCFFLVFTAMSIKSFFKWLRRQDVR